jgi:hypothetical protein
MLKLSEMLDPENLEDQVKQLEKELKQKYPEIDLLHLYLSSNGSLFIGHIRIKPEHRRQGIGKEIIRRIKEFADANHLTISLSPEAEPRYKEKLDKFYKSLGFVDNKGRKKDWQLSSMFGKTMYRRPGVDEAMDPERMVALQKQFAAAPKAPEQTPEQMRKTAAEFKSLPGDKRKAIVRAMQKPCANCEKEFQLPPTGKSHGICPRHFDEQMKKVADQYKKMGMTPPAPKQRNPEDSSTDLKTFTDTERKLVANLYALAKAMKQNKSGAK